MSEADRSDVGRVAAARPLRGLSSGLFVHTVHLPNSGAPPAGLAAIRDLLDQDGIGVIYTMPSNRTRPAMATACVEQTRLRSPRADILLDAALYTGSARRKRAREGIDQSWLNHQHRNLVWALTDSGYVADDDVGGLRTILTQAAAAHERAQARNRGVLAALPLAVSWLTERVDTLVAELNRVGTRHVLQAFAERVRDVPRPVEPERHQLPDLGTDGGMAAQLVEAGLVGDVSPAVRPEQEEQHPREPLLTFRQCRVGRTGRVGELAVRRRPLGIVDVGEHDDAPQECLVVGPGRRRGKPGVATQPRPRALLLVDVRQVTARLVEVARQREVTV